MPKNLKTHNAIESLPIKTWRPPDPDHAFYDSSRWQKLRKAFLRVNPCCKQCEGEGKVTLAEHVHHKIDRRVKPELELTWSNLESLCASHHNSISATKQNG